jgi:uncharacterized protein (TIGR00369 family)
MSQNEIILKTMRENMAKAIALVPWAKEIGMDVIAIERGKARGAIAWSDHLIGDPDTGVIHGGVITSMLDNLAGMAVVSALDEFKSTATLDLRIDYMRPAAKGARIIGQADCYHVTRTVAFIRATAFNEGSEKVIATATGAFALNKPSKWTGEPGVSGGKP